MINIKNDLLDLGWNEDLENQLKEIKEKHEVGYEVGRVSIEHKNMYKIITKDGEILGVVSGKLKHNALNREDYPAVGDWVLIDRTDFSTGNAIIHGILPRKSKFSRKVAGDKTEEQIVAVNVDTLFICMSLNKDFNLRRLERYLLMAWDSGSSPVVLLTKADLCEDIEEKVSLVESIAFGVNIHIVSSVEERGIKDIKEYVNRGRTVAFLGSSGVGKSTLINILLGEDKLKIGDIREDDHKGKHTTTHRELILLKDGGVVIDTPGMRELHVLDAKDGFDNTFSDIEELSLKCKFNDCKHEGEPGCEVRRALDDGTLSNKRYNNYLKLKKEMAYIERKNKINLRQKETQKNKWKSITANKRYNMKAR